MQVLAISSAFELSDQEIDLVAGAIDWGALGNASMALSGAAALLGNMPVSGAFAAGALICYGIDYFG